MSANFYQNFNQSTNPLQPKLNLQLNKLVANLQNRGKHFSHTELVAYADLNLNVEPIPDPLWPLTQMKKNYYYPYTQLIFEQYSNREFFRTQINLWGASNRLIDLANKPVWAKYVVNNSWFWKQLQAIDSADWLTFLPGVKQIYVCGSSILEISHPNSDIDLAIECYQYQVLLARFWVKITLKLVNLDTHTLYEAWQQLLFKFGLINATDINKIDLKPKPNKLDCGIFFENQKQIQEYFGSYERQLFILARGLVLQNYPDVLAWDQSIVNSLFFLPKSKFNQRLYYCCQFGCKLMLYILSLPLLPLILSQVVWYSLKKTPNDDHWLSHRFICFYRRWF